jgi:hypothetical protein
MKMGIGMVEATKNLSFSSPTPSERSGKERRKD